MYSDKWDLTKRDALIGLLMLVGTTAFGAIAQPIEAAIVQGLPWELPNKVQLYLALKAGIGAGIVYIVHKFSTDSVKVAQKTLDKAEEKQFENIRRI